MRYIRYVQNVPYILVTVQNGADLNNLEGKCEGQWKIRGGKVREARKGNPWEDR